MTIENCSNCGGTHYGSNKCPYISKPCIVCGDETILACSDCAINSGGKRSAHVCEKARCRDAHERDNHPKPMPVPMNDKLREIAERLEKATAGPWDTNGCSFEGTPIRLESGGRRVPFLRLGPLNAAFFSTTALEDNADFIAHAPTDIAFLLSALRRMELALEKSVELQSHYAAILNGYDGGERMLFENTDAWVKRLDALAKGAT